MSFQFFHVLEHRWNLVCRGSHWVWMCLGWTYPDILRVLEIVANDPKYFCSTAVYQMTLQSKPSILPLLGLPRGSGLARLDLIQHPDVQRDKVLHYEISLNYHSKLYLANFYFSRTKMLPKSSLGPVLFGLTVVLR